MKKLNNFRNFGNNRSAFYSLKGKATREEDEFELEESDSYCGFFIDQKVSTRIVVPIDSVFKSASHYRLVCNKIEELSEDDVVEFQINSSGGDLNGLVALLHSIRTTEAQTIAVISGDAYSAASLLALACDAVSVGSLANMLCHSASFGTRGKSADVRGHVTHIANYAESIFRDCYEHFLTEDEITDVLEGKELYLDYEQINERLERKYSILKEMQEAGCCGDPSNCENICECPLAEDSED
jgi:ATP-dependent protease ClpP protease subunit